LLAEYEPREGAPTGIAAQRGPHPWIAAAQNRVRKLRWDLR